MSGEHTFRIPKLRADSVREQLLCSMGERTQPIHPSVGSAQENRSGSIVMDDNQRMIAGSAAWALIGGVVACTGCLRGQPISDADDPFLMIQGVLRKMRWLLITRQNYTGSG